MTTDSISPTQLDVQAFTLGLLQSLCDEPDNVAVSVASGACVATVSPADFNRLASSRGRTLRSLSTVLGAATAKQGTRYSLDLRSSE